MEAIRGATLRLGVDPLGGAGVHYWAPIAERYGLNLTVVSETVDPTFRFMTVDWDGRIRMDPSSPYAMQRLIGAEGPLRHRVRLRHRPRPARDRDPELGSAASQSLSRGRHPSPVPRTAALARRAPAVGKTVVSSAMIDRVTAKLRPARCTRCRSASNGSSTGCSTARSASAARRARAPPSSAATARSGRRTRTASSRPAGGGDHRARRARSGRDLSRADARARRAGRRPGRGARHAGAEAAARGALAAAAALTELAGETGPEHAHRAPGNDAPIGGVKVAAGSGWFAARPSGTEDIYKIYAESFRGEEHLRRIVEEAQAIVDHALEAGARGEAAGTHQPTDGRTP